MVFTNEDKKRLIPSQEISQYQKYLRRIIACLDQK